MYSIRSIKYVLKLIRFNFLFRNYKIKFEHHDKTHFFSIGTEDSCGDVGANFQIDTQYIILYFIYNEWFVQLHEHNSWYPCLTYGRIAVRKRTQSNI